MFNKIGKIIKDQLMRGANPKGLAASFAVAFVFGTFPVLGTTTFLCFAFGALFKANQPLTQAVNYLLYPLQLILIPVFLKAGQYVFNGPPMSFGLTEMTTRFHTDWRLFFADYAMSAVYAVLIWVIIIPLVGAIIYLLSYHSIKVASLKAAQLTSRVQG